jgi:hypothetical protein
MHPSPSTSTFSYNYYSPNISREDSQTEALERQLALWLILNRDTTSERAACDIKFLGCSTYPCTGPRAPVQGPQHPAVSARTCGGPVGPPSKSKNKTKNGT